MCCFFKICTKKIKTVASFQIKKKFLCIIFPSLTKTLLLPSLCQNFTSSLVKIKNHCGSRDSPLTHKFSLIYQRSCTVCHQICQFIAVVLRVVSLHHCASSSTFMVHLSIPHLSCCFIYVIYGFSFD